MSVIDFKIYAAKPRQPYSARDSKQRPTPYGRPFVDEREERFRLAGSVGEAQRLKRTQNYRGIEEQMEGRGAKYYLLGISESAVRIPDDLARNEEWLVAHALRTPEGKILGLKKYKKAA